MKPRLQGVMLKLDAKDFVGGVIIVAVGLFMAIYASTRYALGSPQEMGPGFFPTALGVLLVVIGLTLLCSAFLQYAALPAVNFRHFAAILAGGAFFAFSVERFGLVPAVVGMTLIARLAEKKYSVGGSLSLAVALTTIAVVVFRIGLNMPFLMISWGQ